MPRSGSSKIRECGKRFRTMTIGEKPLFYIVLVLFVLMLVPMLALAICNMPSADDYSSANVTLHIWKQTHSLLAVILSGVQAMISAHFNWQGTYSAYFWSTFQPLLLGEEWCFLTTFILLASLLGGTFYFTDTILHRLIGSTKKQAAIVGMILGVAFTQLLPSPAEGFYWWSGAILYTFFFGFALVLYAKLALTLFGLDGLDRPSRRIFRLLELSLVAVIVGGSSYPLILFTALLYVLAALAALWRKKNTGIVLTSCAVYLAAFAVNVLAPGNKIRQTHFESPGALWAIKYSLIRAWQYAGDWLTPMLLCLLLFLVPLFWAAVKRVDWDFRCPGIFVLGSFCLYAAMYCPYLYAVGGYQPGRYADIVYYAYVTVLAVDLFYVTGWVHRKTAAIQTEAAGHAAAGIKEMRYSLPFCALLAAVFLASVLLFANDLQITSVNAARDICNGNAAVFYRTMQQRIELLKDETNKNPVLPRYTVYLSEVISSDITEDPTDWHNAVMATYYGKDSIRLAPPE